MGIYEIKEILKEYSSKNKMCMAFILWGTMLTFLSHLISRGML